MPQIKPTLFYTQRPLTIHGKQIAPGTEIAVTIPEGIDVPALIGGLVNGSIGQDKPVEPTAPATPDTEG